MAASCGLPQDHEPHYDIVDGMMIKCDGDSNHYQNYDNSNPNKPS